MVVQTSLNGNAAVAATQIPATFRASRKARPEAKTAVRAGRCLTRVLQP